MKSNPPQDLKSRANTGSYRIVDPGGGVSFRLHDRQETVSLMQCGGLCLFVALCIVALPQPAWALQTHGAPEGIYVHQMAHFFLMAALVYLGWDISRSSFRGRGWTLLKVFCILFFLWNAMAVAGHAMHVGLGEGDFYTEEGYWLSRMHGPFDIVKIIYYITKFDHFISVPAIFILVISLRSFYRDSCKEDEK